MKKKTVTKMSLKIPRPKVRRTWALNPVTRVGKDSKKYDRKHQKQLFRKSLKEET
jgi:hypothetical protein